MEVSGQFYTPATLLLGIKPLVPIGYEADGPQNQTGHYREEKNLLLLLGIEPQLYSTA
jgi:hypothetical protein